MRRHVVVDDYCRGGGDFGVLSLIAHVLSES